MTTREALAELVAMYDDPAKRDPEWHLRYGRVWAAAREALAQPTVAVDEIAIDAWKLRMVYFNENGDPLMSREPEQSELRAALAQPEPEPVARDLARGLLWVAYVWNDHNFQAAHIEARKVAQRVGIHSLDEANKWLTAAPPPPAAQPAGQWHSEGVAAMETLKRMGYTYCGGELWKPPLGTAQPALSDEQIDIMWIKRDCIEAIQQGDIMGQLRSFARAIERALKGQP